MSTLAKTLLRALAAAFTAIALVAPAQAAPILIDPTPPPFADPPSPWQSLAGDAIITYAFKPSFDNALTWSPAQKAVAYDALNTLDNVLPDQTFVEAGDFTLRFAASDLFKDWRDGGSYNHPGWDLTGALAIAYKHNNAPWDHSKYPNNEIYFNFNHPWSFNPLWVDPDGFDFWTVLLHETIHMLASDAHAIHENEVMFPTLDKGVRKFLQKSDAEILRAAGYNVAKIPEPATIVLFAVGLAGLVVSRRRRSERSVFHRRSGSR